MLSALRWPSSSLQKIASGGGSVPRFVERYHPVKTENNYVLEIEYLKLESNITILNVAIHICQY